ncbi:MAG: T9SS type A sorting domain-containing protein [Saprospiraceae bacterium]|nr:T9SS type A sorting domain-containing protein [Saprospiraceae bacterium]
MLKIIRIPILLFFLLPNAFILRGQNTAEMRRYSIPFNGTSATNATVGGLNAPMFGEADFDKNGKPDVFAFDRIGNVRMAFLNNPSNPISPIFNPQFTAKIPELNDWALMRDFNGDGAADIFTYDGSGIRVFKGKYTNDSLGFERMNFAFNGNILSYPLSNGFKINLYVNAVDIPAIDDIDGDGDLDILAFEVGGGHVYLYKNQSVERGFQRDSLIFQLEDNCWGKFYDNGFQPSVKLGTPTTCASSLQGDISASLRHPGATIATFDADNDGDKDALLGSISYANLSFLKNDGTKTAAFVGSQDNNFPANTEGVNLPVFPAAFFSDWDGDGIKDVAVTTVSTNFVENKNVAWLYKNVGTNALPRFNLQRKNYLVGDMVDLGSGANPVFVESNNDGLLDLVVGNGSFYLPQNGRDARLFLYRNTGLPNAPTYTLIDSNWLNFKSFSDLDVNNFAPTFGDLDGDGDLDMLVGEDTGTLFFVENKSNNKGILQMSTPIPNWKNMQIGAAPKPQIIDLDRDGLLDIVVGTRNGLIRFFRNKGTRTAPDFNPQANSTKLGNVDVSELGDPAGYVAPQFVEFKGKYTLICGSSNGRIRVYDSIDNNIYGNYRLVNADYGKLRDGWRTTPTIGNLITTDDKLEMIVGNLRGGISAYTLSYNVDGTTLIQRIDNQIFATVFPNPTTNYLTIETTENCDLKLINYLGQIVKMKKNIPPQYKLNLDGSASGMYFLELMSNTNKRQILKVVKK